MKTQMRHGEPGRWCKSRSGVKKFSRISQELNEKNPSKKSHKAPQKITNKKPIIPQKLQMRESEKTKNMQKTNLNNFKQSGYSRGMQMSTCQTNYFYIQ